MCAYHFAVSVAAKKYNSQLKNRRASHFADVAAEAHELGYLALSMTLVRNPPAFDAKQQYCTQIEKIIIMLGKL